MKILFIGHQFHAKTLSNRFFLDTLQEFFDVTVALIDPADVDGLAGTAVAADVDLVVLWQMDFLAPVFLARGLRTIVIPMYDGSEQMPDLHWLWAAGGSFINFSRRLAGAGRVDLLPGPPHRIGRAASLRHVAGVPLATPTGAGG